MVKMSGKKYLVYKHTNKVNGLVYIGITCQKPEKRWDKGRGYKPAKDANGNEKPLYFWNAINKYGWDGFDHLILVRGLTKEEAEWLEIQLIAAYDSTDPNKGYNLTKGGGGANGYKRTKASRRKQSESISGEKHHMYGKHHTEEALIKMRENHADLKGKKSVLSKTIICITTRQVYYGAYEAERATGVAQQNISKVCNNRGGRKHAGKLPDGTKLKWAFVENLPKPQVPEDIKQLLRNGPKPLKIVC
jgi:group I intron endonuclease